MLGGSHGMNLMVYLRGNDRDYNEWEELGNPTWNWRNALRYFKKSEHNKKEKFVSQSDGKYHSASGKLIVDDYPGTAFDRILIDAGKEFGYNYVEDPNAGVWVGFSSMQGTLHGGRRQSTAKTFLTPASKRPNLHIIKNALVTKIEIGNGQTEGVRFVYQDNRELVARKRKDVILSAGAFGSPQLLMLSGVGPRSHLQRFEIPVKRDLPVGGNLHDHIAVPLFHALRMNYTETDEDLLREQLDSIYQFAIHGDGPLAGFGASKIVGYINSENGTQSPYPDFQILFVRFKRGHVSDLNLLLTLYKMKHEAKRTLLEQVTKSDLLGMYVILMKSKSRGKVELSGPSVADKPNILLNSFGDDADMKAMLRGVKRTLDFGETNTFREYDTRFVRLPVPESECGVEFDSEQCLRSYIRQFSFPFYHPVSTAKMGPDTDAEAVVDSRLCVKGIGKLRVIDASVMPVIPSANTNPATIMIAEKGADLIKSDWLGKLI